MFICNMFQCLLTASFTFDKKRLSVKVNRILYLYFSFCVNRSSLFLVLLYFHIFQPLYPVSISFFQKMSQLSLKSQSLVHFCFERPGWAYGILRFKDSGCFDFLWRKAWQSVSFLNDGVESSPLEVSWQLCLRNLHFLLNNWNQI